MTEALQGFSDDYAEFRGMAAEWAKAWTQVVLSHDSLTAEERDRVRKAVPRLYVAADLAPPVNVAVADGPVSMSIASGIASGVWYLREHPIAYRRMFGADLDETALLAAMETAVRLAVPVVWANLGLTPNFDAIEAATRAAIRATVEAAAYGEQSRAAVTRAEAVDLMVDVAQSVAAEVAADAAALAFEAAYGTVTDAAIGAVTEAAATTGDELADSERLASTLAVLRGVVRSRAREMVVQAASSKTNVSVRDVEHAVGVAARRARRARKSEDIAESEEALHRWGEGEAKDVVLAGEVPSAALNAFDAQVENLRRQIFLQHVRAAAARSSAGETIDAVVCVGTVNAVNLELVAETDGVDPKALLSKCIGTDLVEEISRGVAEATAVTSPESLVQTVVPDLRMFPQAEPQDLVRFLVLCCQDPHLGSQRVTRSNLYKERHHGAVFWVSFFHHVISQDRRYRVSKVNFDQWADYEVVAAAGLWYAHDKFCVVADRPSGVQSEEEPTVSWSRRLHSATEPSCTWRDGFALYHWRGTRVPQSWIENPESIDPSEALMNLNIERRRCVAEILGWKRVLEKFESRVIDANSDPQVGTLIEVDLPRVTGNATTVWGASVGGVTGGRSRFLHVKCATGREFVLAVPPDIETALAANAWTYGIVPEQFKPEVRT